MELLGSLDNGGDPDRPSLFELLSEQQLAALLPPTLRYLLVVATQQYPRYLLRVLNSFDEIYALSMVVIERYYLRTFGGSFTENFYGLKRERVLRIRGGQALRTQLASPSLMRETLKLSRADVWKNILVMVGIPYLKRKLDEAYDIHTPNALLQTAFQRDTLDPDATIRQKLFYYYKWFLRRVYPYVNMGYYLSLLAFNLAYLFSSTSNSSPFLWLINTRIRRMNESDHRAIEQLSKPQSSPGANRPGETISLFSPRFFTHKLLPQLLSSLRFLLPTSIFALKFLEWWHASDFAKQLTRKVGEDLELPPPIIAGLPFINSRRTGTEPKQLKSSLKSTSTPPLHRSSSVSLSSQSSSSGNEKKAGRHSGPPISSITALPIFTVAPAPMDHQNLCPICLHIISNPTAASTGYVYCMACITRWVEGTHERQESFMKGESGQRDAWTQDQALDPRPTEDNAAGTGSETPSSRGLRSREGRWESGKGRCAVSGYRLLGGTSVLRRVIV